MDSGMKDETRRSMLNDWLQAVCLRLTIVECQRIDGHKRERDLDVLVERSLNKIRLQLLVRVAHLETDRRWTLSVSVFYLGSGE